MKYFLGISIVLLLLSACGEDAPSTEVENKKELENGDNFVISGAVSGANNMTFYLQALSQQGIIEVANTVADKDGNFEMVGNIPAFGIYQLSLGEAGNKIIPLTIVPGDQVKLTADFATFETSPTVSGTKWAETMTEYMQKFSQFHEDQNSLMANRGTMTDDELTEKFMALKKPIDEYAISAMKNDPENPFNIVLSASATPAMGFENWDPANLETLKLVSSAFEKAYPDSPIAATMSNQSYQIELSYNDYVANSSGTRQAPEIALNTPDGKLLKLSSLKGKVVLIDFWASWCAPCRRENPNVVRLYHEYKNKGFTVFSVSLDKDREKWVQAIKEDGLVWPNHVSDLLQWESSLPQLYGFSGIPYTVLLNQEGKIIGTGLRGNSLEQKLKEIFSK